MADKAKANRKSPRGTSGKRSGAPGNAAPEPATQMHVRRGEEARMCVVGLGASAGGMEALRHFFEAMPADSGLAFVVIQHLDPTHESLAAELLGRWTAMPVAEATHAIRLEPDRVYTIPPNTDMSIEGGALQLAAPQARHGLRMPIDHFFRSLGTDQRERGIGIILSGSGTDGTLGLKTIEDNGGIVLVQQPETAQFDGMPRSAIATGLVQFVLPVESMPEVLVGYARHPYIAAEAPAETLEEAESQAFKAIFDVVRRRRGYSFAGYRRSTLMRRIQRRMGLYHIGAYGEYAALLERKPTEIDEVFKDLLIGVTEFFRDPEAWNALASEVIAPLVEEKGRDEPIRVWVPGAATGEEAFSVAMLILEQLRKVKKQCPVQVFATDANEEAIQAARAHVFPANVAAQISPERLRAFFVRTSDENYFQVSGELRDVVVFGVQNVLVDPPFSRLDLISCRNLLIYLEPEVQGRVVSLFHFALRPGGYLFLGAAEAVGSGSRLFSAVSKKWRIFRYVGIGQRDTLQFPIATGEERPTPLGAAPRRPVDRSTQIANIAQKAIFENFVPAAVLVNAKFESLYYCGPTEKYLVRPRGAPTDDLLAQVRNGLRSRLRAALRQAAAGDGAAVVVDARMRRGDAYEQVKLTAMQAGTDGDSGRLLLVVFEDMPAPAVADDAASAGSSVVRQLEEELRGTKEDLQGTIERLETSYDDLRISNAEVVTINEELQSINEELESSKEELQSLNEELTTVNQQLQGKVSELEASNNDLNNLLGSSDIATICLDRGFRIKWFTPAMRKVLNLMSADVGRPIGDFSLAPAGGGFLADAEAVLMRLVPMQREFKSMGGIWFVRRMLPYRTERDQIDGVVITMTDVTETRQATEAALQATAAADVLENRVRERTAQLRTLSHELAMTEARERRSLAQNLHDGIGQALSIARIKLSTLEKGGEVEKLRQATREVIGLVDQANQSARSLIFELSPPILYELGLAAALQWLADDMRARYGLEVALEQDGSAMIEDQVANVTLFRCVRELLINVAKHAKVDSAKVSLQNVDGQTTVIVEDAGCGFEYSEAGGMPPPNDYGLLSIRERIGYLDGAMEIATAPGQGTKVTLTVPLPMAPSPPPGPRPPEEVDGDDAPGAGGRP